MRISDWSSDVCSSDLAGGKAGLADEEGGARQFHVAGRGGEDHAVGGDELDLAEHRVAIDAAHVGAGLKRGGELGFAAGSGLIEIGRASCRERGCQYVSISVVAVTFTNIKLNQP